ncbi:MAG: response regulator transcription factor [Deltaproteobacteria bacterium]|nr:response regulator transcription factor [Deltaproteobacteria bacterium]
MKEGFDLVILDLMLPDIEGEAVCRYIREFSDVPIIMLTARGSEDDRIKGLTIGADDYIVKPFSPRELVARVRIHLKRSKSYEKEFLSFESTLLLIYPKSMEVKMSGRPIPLTPTEFRILMHMAQRPQVIFTRYQIMNAVLGCDSESYDRVVDAHIKNIRHKMGDDPHNPLFIKTVYGVGYKFIGIPD